MKWYQPARARCLGPAVLRRSLLPVVAVSLVCLSAAAGQEQAGTLKRIPRAGHPENFVNLQTVANRKLNDNLGRLPNNSLQPLEPGIYQSGETEFKIDEKLIQLGSTVARNHPASVDIPVGKQAASLELLHATVNGGHQAPHATHVDEGSVVGNFVFQYADGTKASADLTYGSNVRDWWSWDGGKQTKDAKVAWVGVNPACRRYKVHLRLFHTTLKNPHPDKPVKSLTYSSTMNTAAGPFCVAITVGN